MYFVWASLLWVLWAAFLFGGFWSGKLNADQTHRIPRPARMASSLVLVLAAWLSWLLMRVDARLTDFALWIAVGMTLGFIGDLFMAQLLSRKNHVFGGIAAFGLGHVAYIIAILTLAAAFGLDDPGARWGALAVWLLIGAAGWYRVVFRGQTRSLLHYAALPYALLLASTAGFATGLALQEPLFIPLAAGAALFLLSDLLLAAQLFNKLHFRSIGDVVWFLYGPGQMLIVYTPLFAALMTGLRPVLVD